ncbi:ATP-dependent DNA helicase Q1 isoform 3-T3 [Pholidichthys leucotaenia]
MDIGGGANDLQAKLDSVEAELELVELQIAELQQKRSELTSRKNALLQQLEDACNGAQPSSSSSAAFPKSPGSKPGMSKEEMQKYDGTDFLWSREVEQHLKDSFRLFKFRPLQLRAINLTMSGSDLFLVMPTGRGKSLCYQLPAVCSKGFTLVVTPLVSLMEDQIMYLKSIEVSAVMLNASSSKVCFKDSDSDTSINDICSLIKTRYKDQSGIVYVFSQKDAESVSSELQKRDILAYPYHANMDPEDKSRVHRKWTSNKIQVVVATVAFGMGIDKPDVRFVIHHTISKSIENYYQESGRAGRDDRPADCIVYFGFADIFRISTMVVMENVGQQKLLQMVDYCQSVDRCRRSLMAVHFDEVWDDEGCNQMCDTCRHAKDYSTVDIIQHGRQVLQIVEVATSMDEKLTPLKLVEAWMGKGPAKRRKMIQTTTLSRRQAESVIVHLLLKGYLREDFSFTPYTTYFYVKLGRKAPLLKSQTHTLSMKMRTSGTSAAAAGDTSVKVREEEVDMITEPVVLDTSTEPQPKQKLLKEQKNLCRRQDLKQVSQTDKRTECANDQLADGNRVGEEDKRRVVLSKHLVEVVVEINRVSNEAAGDIQRTPSRPCKLDSKRKSSTPQRARRRPSAAISAVGIVSPSLDCDTPTNVPSSPSQASSISAAAAEELCDLRNYYRKQLRRINYISHEHLGQPAEPGMLSCISEPLRSLRLPCKVTITRTARSLWTRVSGRKKFICR